MSDRVLNFGEFSSKYAKASDKGLNDLTKSFANFEVGFDDESYNQQQIGPNKPISKESEKTPASPGEAGSPKFTSNVDPELDSPNEETEETTEETPEEIDEVPYEDDEETAEEPEDNKETAEEPEDNKEAEDDEEDDEEDDDDDTEDKAEETPEPELGANPRKMKIVYESASSKLLNFNQFIKKDIVVEITERQTPKELSDNPWNEEDESVVEKCTKCKKSKKCKSCDSCKCKK